MDLQQNIALWNSVEHWETGALGNGQPLREGEKWSRAWGDSRFRWAATLLPRIQHFLPASTILEIACGRGRWSQYLMDRCDRIVLQDISDTCVDHCRRRFTGRDHVDFLLGRGSDLPGIAEDSIDFIFSFDSLVHADRTVMEGYLAEIGRVLKPGGAAFLHHSNLAGIRAEAVARRHLRDPTVSARDLLGVLPRHGLACEICELIPWDADQAAAGQCTDALTTLRKGPARAAPRVVENLQSLELEKEVARRLHAIYAGPAG